MSILRSERNSAALLLIAAAAGLVLANTAAGPALLAAKDAHVGFAAIGLDLSLGHWISDGLLAIFFFIVAVELKHEFVARDGSLNSPSRAAVPAIAALGGVIVPAGIYLLVVGVGAGASGVAGAVSGGAGAGGAGVGVGGVAGAGGGYLGGWPIPTATDIAFALGVLAIFGRRLPAKVRVFLLALAVLDDLVAILIIAVFFTTTLNVAALGAAAVGVLVFGVLGRVLARRGSSQVRAPQRGAAAPGGDAAQRGGAAQQGGVQENGGVASAALITAMVVVALATWYFMYLSGVHATIAGVALGLVLAGKPAARAAHSLQPYSNGVVLPLFAFAAALVAIPAVGIGELTPAFWGILIALPVGKLLGITLAGLLANATVGRRARPAAPAAPGAAPGAAPTTPHAAPTVAPGAAPGAAPATTAAATTPHPAPAAPATPHPAPTAPATPHPAPTAPAAPGAAPSRTPLLTLPDLIAVGTLGGIGFTVSLLMNELAFAGRAEVVDEGTLAVLLGSAVSIVVAALVVGARSRAYRREATPARPTASLPAAD